MKTTLSTYEAVCETCIDNLYRMAHLALLDPSDAEAAVTKICVNGVHRYSSLTDPCEIRRRLVRDLYRVCRLRLMLHAPDPGVLPEKLRFLTHSERLTSAVRFSAGMDESDTAWVLGITQSQCGRLVSEIAAKMLI